MPYGKAQAQAIFLNIKRKKGEAEAKEFGRKHRADLSGGYKVRSARASSSPGSDAAQGNSTSEWKKRAYRRWRKNLRLSEGNNAANRRA